NGYRDLATNGVDKPVLNVFRMFGLMAGQRVEVSGDLAYDVLTVRDSSIRGPRPDISALAAADERSASVMVWNYHDDDVDAADATVEVTVVSVPAVQVLLHHYRVDRRFSNSYEVWKKMGSPQNPTPQQTAELERAGQLELLAAPVWLKTQDGRLTLPMTLPRQGVSLLKLTW
ncbi:MAG TPA: hypothetical protein PKV53_03905, partial [Anaerohalosphaeraceae bacterium]|nr:hypothetical protein [Anaerohalosphaeraceae bacterium]